MADANVPRRAQLQPGMFDVLVPRPTVPQARYAGQVDVGYHAPARRVKHFSPDPNLDISMGARIGMAAAFIRWPVTNPDFLEDNVATWVYSAIDMVFPGLAARALNGDDKVVVERIVLNSLDYDVIRAPNLAETPIPNAPVPADGAPAPMYPPIRVSGLECTPTEESALWLHVVGALTVLIFSLGKNASEENFTAFTERRPGAIANKLGNAIDITSPLHVGRLPALRHFRLFAGYFNSHHMQRRTLVRTLIMWNRDPNPSDEMDVVITQTKLWHQSGMTPIFLVRDFLQNYGPAVIRIPGLCSEVIRYMEVFRQWDESADAEKDYLRVIDGDKAQLGNSRLFNGLVCLARGLAASVDQRFTQYASALGESAYRSVFIEICADMDLPLPAAYVSGAADVTGGGVAEH